MNATEERVDVVIVGAEYNGLACASYRARKGLKAKFDERRGVVGGTAVTEEFHPSSGVTGVPGHSAARKKCSGIFAMDGWEAVRTSGPNARATALR